jgi:hypothetical protein
MQPCRPRGRVFQLRKVPSDYLMPGNAVASRNLSRFCPYSEECKASDEPSCNGLFNSGRLYTSVSDRSVTFSRTTHTRKLELSRNAKGRTGIRKGRYTEEQVIWILTYFSLLDSAEGVRLKGRFQRESPMGGPIRLNCTAPE